MPNKNWTIRFPDFDFSPVKKLYNETPRMNSVFGPRFHFRDLGPSLVDCLTTSFNLSIFRKKKCFTGGVLSFTLGFHYIFYVQIKFYAQLKFISYVKSIFFHISRRFGTSKILFFNFKFYFYLIFEIAPNNFLF